MTEAQVDAYWAEQVSEPAAPQMLNESPSVERTLDNSEVEHHYGIQRQHYGMEEK